MSIPTQAILQHLDLARQTPSLDYLNAILVAWSARIPWETASRIARHQQDGTAIDYARFPSQFFADALDYSTGGTCFETNLALRALLTDLGFTSALHFCDMETPTINPHCALTVELESGTYLADMGYPIPGALRLDDTETTHLSTPAYAFRAIPHFNHRWEVRREATGYESQSFVLKGEPIDEETFKARLIRDHEPDGLFLDEVIISKTTGAGMLRYSPDKGLVIRTHEAEVSVPLLPEEEGNLVEALSRRFDLSSHILAIALNRK